MSKQIETKILNHQPKPLGQKQSYAVLIPLIKLNGDYHLLYQIRGQHIPQPGEVAFPGGKVEDGESPAEAVVRETCEELKLSPNQIQLIGELDYLVSQDRTIHCFVGYLDWEGWQNFHPNDEVAELFTLSLKDLMATEPTYYQLSSQTRLDSDFPFDRIPNGINYRFSEQNRLIPFYENFSPTIWGITALFTHHFCQIVNEK